MHQSRRSAFTLTILMLSGICLGAEKPATKASAPQDAIPEVVRAQRFELVDKSGNTRAWLGTLDDGTTVLQIRNKEGRQKVLVCSDGRIMVVDEQDKARVTVGQMDQDYGVGVFDATGKIRAQLRVESSGDASVSVRDSDGNIRGVLCTVADDPVILLSDGRDHGGGLGLRVKDSAPLIVLLDSEGKQRSTYFLTDKGFPALQMMNQEGKSYVEMSADAEQPSLNLWCPKSRMTGFMGFSGDRELSVMLMNAEDNARAGIVLVDDGPSIVVAHPDGTPAARITCPNDGPAYFQTTDSTNTILWKSP